MLPHGFGTLGRFQLLVRGNLTLLKPRAHDEDYKLVTEAHIMKRSQQSGFTLIELAIVIVIIGLLIGGVLTGQDLIKAAGISATVRQTGEINSAATTFRTKYNGLPGDLLNTKALQVGFNTAGNDANRDGTAGKGDGNGLIEGCSAAAATNYQFGCESALFWSDLTRAGLIPGSFTFDSATGAVAAGTMANYVPQTKLRDSTTISVFTANGHNYIAIAAMAAAGSAAGAGSAITYTADAATAGLTPREAKGIDEKTDDANPLTGATVAIANGTNPGTINAGTAAPAAAGACVNGQAAATASYNSLSDTNLNAPACAISIRSAF